MCRSASRPRSIRAARRSGRASRRSSFCRRPDWAGRLRATWAPGEKGAHARLAGFLDEGLATLRRPATALARIASRACRRICAAARSRRARFSPLCRPWRPRQKAPQNFLANSVGASSTIICSSAIPMRRGSICGAASTPCRGAIRPTRELAAWRRGRTGHPLVDAGIRELWTDRLNAQPRARMVAASFLVKHLLIDWRIGEEWFWDTLCDADAANNPMKHHI